ncbi:MAG: hypothetical protein V3T64_02315, partial [Myxococcota bacterium]
MGERTVSIVVKLKDLLTRPLGQVNRRFQAIGASVQKLKTAFGPLTGQVTALVSAFAGLTAIREGLRLAEVQAEAEARLEAALGGVGDEFERIIKLTADIQARTTFGDEALIRVAALLAEAGLRGEELNAALEATVQGSTAAQRSIDDFARTLIDTFTRGQVPEELTRFVVGLKELDEAALRSGEAFRIIAAQFAGSAEAIAATHFGKAIQLSNELGDVFERLGDVLVGLKVAILDALVDAFKELIEVVETDEFRALVNIFSSLARILIRNLPLVIKIGVGIAVAAIAFKALAIAIALVNVAIAIFGVLATPVGLLTVALVALGVAVIALTVDFEALGEIAGEVFIALGAGTISIVDIFTLLANTARLTFQTIRKFFLIPLEVGFKAVVATLNFLASQVVVGLQILAVGAVLAIGRAFEGVLQTIGRSIDFLTNTAADALRLILGVSKEVADSIRTTLGDISFKVVDDLSVKFDELADTARTQQSEFRTEIDLIRQTGLAQITAAENAIESLTKSQVDFFVKVSEGAAKALEDTRRLEQEQADLLVQRALKEAQLQDRITQIRTNKNRAAQEAITKLELVELERRFKAQELSAAEFIEARRDLEFGLIRDQLIGLVQLRTQIEENIAVQRAAGEDVSATLNRQIAIETRIQQLRFQGRDLNQRIAAERITLADEIEARVTEAEQAIQDVIARNNEL